MTPWPSEQTDNASRLPSARGRAWRREWVTGLRSCYGFAARRSLSRDQDLRIAPMVASKTLLKWNSFFEAKGKYGGSRNLMRLPSMFH
jgi:hypothetical protein